MKLLKQSTAVNLKFGPFLDSTDGVTAETALTISQSDVILFKNFGAGSQKNDSGAATHDTAGWYVVPLNTTDTNTLGALQIHVNESGALPVFDHYTVVPANIYDSWVLGTDLQQVDVEQVDGSATAATNQSLSGQLMQAAVVTDAGFSPTTTEFETGTITEATADHYIGRVVLFTSGALQYQATRITDYALASGRGHFTVQTLTEAPANSDTFLIV